MIQTSSGAEEAARNILQKLKQGGFEAWFAGGCVRDRLLGLTPKDYDIATSARPEDVERLFPKTLGVGRAFGVILVLEGPHQIEVATFRSDDAYVDGRRPVSVHFTDHRQDVLRRDFTVNGLLYDPIEDRLLDLVGGREDLAVRRIRTIGDPRQRFDEDKLRLMRAVRFACELGFEIEPGTWAAIVEQAPSLTQVSAERIREELRRILLAPARSRGLDLLHRSGLLRVFLPEVADMEGVQQPPNYHPEGDVWIHTKLAMEHLENPSFEVAMGTLLHDVGKPKTFSVSDRIRFNKHEVVGADMAAEICKRLRFSNEETDRVVWMVARHMDFRQVHQMRASTLRRLMGHDYFPDLELVHRADVLASNKDLSALEFVRQVRAQTPEVKPTPLLRGADLIDLGLTPGPAFSEILKAAYDAQLEGLINTHEEALGFARKQGGTK